MGGGTRRLRLRAVASSWFPVLVVALLAAVAVGGWATYTAHAAPGTSDHQVEQRHWTVTGEFEHSADVTRENPVFDVGETLTNRSTYFTAASPVLDGQFAATYAGGAADPASMTLDATLVVRSADENTVYWTERTPLEEATVAAVDPGASANVSFSVNASRLANRTSAIEEDLGQTPGDTEAFVAVTVAANGTVDGRPAALSFTHRLPVSVDGDTYTVGPTDPTRESMTTTATVGVQREYGPLRSLGGPLALVAGGGGLAALAVARRRDALALSDAERRYLAFRRDRDEFDEWVVTARLPAVVRDRPRADADTLGDLVDFAIDTDSGVVEDPDTGTFYAVGEQLLVAYEPPELAATRGEDDADAVGVAAQTEDGSTRTASGDAQREGVAAQTEDGSTGTAGGDAQVAGETGETRDGETEDEAGERQATPGQPDGGVDDEPPSR